MAESKSLFYRMKKSFGDMASKSKTNAKPQPAIQPMKGKSPFKSQDAPNNEEFGEDKFGQK